MAGVAPDLAAAERACIGREGGGTILVYRQVMTAPTRDMPAIFGR
jgi:hypothetical protein